MITDSMRHHVKERLCIDYEEYIKQPGLHLNPQQLREIADVNLSEKWIEKYQLQCDQMTSVLSIIVDGYTFLWDSIYERVVAVYGISPTVDGKKEPRNKSRIAYYYRNFVKRHQPETTMDTGHFIAHSLGGGLDMNLFPQKRDINQGRSVEGVVYRKMENYASKHPGTFVFSRPIYFDDTWRPFFLEYGVLKTDFFWWTCLFDNI